MGGIATRWFSIGKKGRNWTRRIDNAFHHHHRQESIRSLSHLLPSLPSLLFCSRSTVILQLPDRDVAVTSLFSPRNILRPPTLTPLPTIVRSSRASGGSLLGDKEHRISRFSVSPPSPTLFSSVDSRAEPNCAIVSANPCCLSLNSIGRGKVKFASIWMGRRINYSRGNDILWEKKYCRFATNRSIHLDEKIRFILITMEIGTKKNFS